MALGAAAFAAAPASASQATSCPPQTADLKIQHAAVGQPFTSVVAVVGCLPMDETLLSITIDWGDGATSSGTATFQTEYGATSKTALISGVHTYANGTCVVGNACPPTYLPKASVVTASDGATVFGGGYGVVAEIPGAIDPGVALLPVPKTIPPVKLAPPSLALDRAAPSVFRQRRRLVVNPRVRAICSTGATCTAKVVVRRQRGRATIGTAIRQLGAGYRAVPAVPLSKAAATALNRGSAIPVRIDVTVRDAAGAGEVRSRRTTLHLRR